MTWTDRMRRALDRLLYLSGHWAPSEARGDYHLRLGHAYVYLAERARRPAGGTGQ
jgi:hypothetical protein